VPPEFRLGAVGEHVNLREADFGAPPGTSLRSLFGFAGKPTITSVVNAG